MGAPVGIAELVGDQLVGGFRVRHAQERLRQRQQGDALRRVEAIFLQELVHPAGRLSGSKLRQHPHSAAFDPPPRFGIERGGLEERRQHLGFRRAVQAADFRAGGRRSVRCGRGASGCGQGLSLSRKGV
jgi:hypothetical protein